MAFEKDHRRLVTTVKIDLTLRAVINAMASSGMYSSVVLAFCEYVKSQKKATKQKIASSVSVTCRRNAGRA